MSLLLRDTWTLDAVTQHFRALFYPVKHVTPTVTEPVPIVTLLSWENWAIWSTVDRMFPIGTAVTRPATVRSSVRLKFLSLYFCCTARRLNLVCMQTGSARGPVKRSYFDKRSRAKSLKLISWTCAFWVTISGNIPGCCLQYWAVLTLWYTAFKASTWSDALLYISFKP